MPSYSRQLLSGNAQALLVEEQPLLDDASGALADLVMPLRGPAVGSFRTGWRTREFDAWLEPRHTSPPPDLAAISNRLEEELLIVPIADLSWFWIERSEGAGAGFSPRLEPECSRMGTRPPPGR